MKRKIQVHALPTNKASGLYKHTRDWKGVILNNPPYEFTSNKTYIENAHLISSRKAATNAQDKYVFYHLYFTMEGETKQGDICIDPSNNSWGINANSWNPNNQKIVATTNPELRDLRPFGTVNDGSRGVGYAAQIGENFVQRWVSEANAGRMIEEAMLEFVDWTDKPKDIGSTMGESNWGAENVGKLKLKSDGSVIVSPVIERKYTREEIKAAIKEYCSSKPNYDPKDIDKFMDEFYPE